MMTFFNATVSELGKFLESTHNPQNPSSEISIQPFFTTEATSSITSMSALLYSTGCKIRNVLEVSFR